VLHHHRDLVPWRLLTDHEPGVATAGAVGAPVDLERDLTWMLHHDAVALVGAGLLGLGAAAEGDHGFAPSRAHSQNTTAPNSPSLDDGMS